MIVMQWAINRKQPLCNAVLPGTHNSGITLAEGYGNLDLQFQEYFKWISWVVRFSIDYAINPLQIMRYKHA